MPVAPPVNIPGALSRIAGHWQPHRVATVNNQELKAVKLLGEFVWHDHDVDELFYVLSGTLSIDVRDSPGAEAGAPAERTVVLEAGDVVVIPAGVFHRPHCEQEVHALLFEPRGVVNTGSAGGALTSKLHELE